MMKNQYLVVENENCIRSEKFSVRWTGDKSNPLFVAVDVAKGMGYSYPQPLYRKFDPSYLDGQNGKGRRLVRSLTISQMEEVLGRKDKRTNSGRTEFKNFWENFVLPEFDARYKVIAEQKKQIEALLKEVEQYQEKLKNIANIAA